jgi:uncharacterized protein YkwD
MNFVKTSLLAMAVFCLTTSCQKDAAPETIQEELNYSIDLNLANETDWEMANEILTLVNAHRATLNLDPLERDQQYASAYAVDHTKYMIDMSQINHDHFQERSAAMKARGAKIVTENVAFGYNDAASVVNAWLNSASHRAAIEGPYTHSGFGVIPGNNGAYYFTQLFYME